MHIETTKILDEVVLINIEVSQWTGRKQLKPEDLVNADDLPPGELASLGHKKTVDPRELTVFDTLKKRMERKCLEFGTRFLGGYAVPVSHFDEVAEYLEECVFEGQQAKKAFLNRYASIVDDWVAQHSGYEAIIRRAVTPVEDVRDRIQFNWISIRVSPHEEGAGAGKMDAKAMGLGTELLSEIALSARQTYDKSFKGKSQVGQKALRPLRSIRTKLEALRFLDKRINPICSEIDAVLDELPKTGAIQGSQMAALRGLILLLGDETAMKGHAAGGDSADTEQFTASVEDIPDQETPEPEIEAEAEVADLNTIKVDEHGFPTNWF